MGGICGAPGGEKGTAPVQEHVDSTGGVRHGQVEGATEVQISECHDARLGAGRVRLGGLKRTVAVAQENVNHVGTQSAHHEVQLPVPIYVAVGDFNGDGKPDLVVASNAGTEVTVLLNNGDGTFRPGVDYAAGSGVWSVAVGDFTGNGKLDLAVTNSTGNTVSILLGNGDGTFGAATPYPEGATKPEGVAVGDFNNDGKLDLVTANYLSNTVSVLLGNGNGSFQSALTFASGGTSTEFVVVGDFNSDGNLDVAVGNATAGVAGVLLGEGNGMLQKVVTYRGVGAWLAVGDLNANGILDLASSGGTHGVTTLNGNGNGTFQPAIDYEVGPSVVAVAVGDFTNDGLLDIALTDSGQFVGIMVNETRAKPVRGGIAKPVQ